LDSANSGIVWDKFQVFQGHKANTPYIQIGRRTPQSDPTKLVHHQNPLKRALQYRSILDAGDADSQAHLARLCDTPRSTIAAYLRLLNLDAKVQTEVLSVDDGDESASCLTEARLRPLLGQNPGAQRKGLRLLLKGGTR
jgi:hypothetical protein